LHPFILLRVCWSENRNSDDIVVYVGDPKGTFDNLSDKMYETRKYFGYQHSEEAAQYIADWFAEKLKKEEKVQEVQEVALISSDEVEAEFNEPFPEE
jgi:hypothetical protein